MTRAKHDRTRDHRGTESTEWITLSGPIGDFDEDDPLDDLLVAMATASGVGYHLEVVLHDFGSGPEPVTDDDGDWLYNPFPGGM